MHNSRHEAGDEVLLAEEPPAPSLVPESTPLPPRTIEEPYMREIRQFYVHQPDVDPAGGGIGFTDGCKGCRAIVFGTTRTGHDNHCRHRVIKTAATNPFIAARVKVAVDRDVAWHAKKLEASETSRRKPEITRSEVPTLASTGKRKAEEQESEENPPEVPVTFEENMSSTPGSSSQSKFDTKNRG